MLDTKKEAWVQADFSKNDEVFYMAGIEYLVLNPEIDDLYYKVNSDMTLEIVNTR